LEKKKSNLNRSSSTASGLSTCSSIDSLSHWNDDDNYEDESLITAEMLSLKILKENLDFISIIELTKINDKKFDSSVNPIKPNYHYCQDYF
jgi:hypothetical protein